MRQAEPPHGAAGDLNPQQLIFFAILVAAIGLLITERLRPDVVAVLIILGLALTGVLRPEQALSGFSSEPAIVIAAMFVLSGGFRHTGLDDLLGQAIGRFAGRGLTRMLAVLMPAVALLSAFTHHVTITAIMLPVTLTLAREAKLSPSKLLLPVAIASSLGTTITIIGAPSFLVASELLRQAQRPGLAVFSIAPIGLALTLVGTVFMLLVGRFLLPSRQAGADAAEHFRLEDYFTELRVLPDSALVGKTIEEAEADANHPFTVVGRVRHGEGLRPPEANGHLCAGDVFLIRAAPETLVAIRQLGGVELDPVARYAEDAPAAEPEGEPEELPERLAQAIVAPRSGLAGRTLSEVDFRRRYGALVLGLWRKDGFAPDELARTRLRAGDVLVVQGNREALRRVGEDRGFLMLTPFQGEVRRPRRAILAGLIMLGTVLAVAFGWTSLGIGALAGATAMVLVGCLTVRQAYRAIDAPMYLFIAGAIPLGAAMKGTGAAELLAGWLQAGLGGWSQTLILLALFATVGLIVQFMGSDSATTALFGPIAIAFAQALGQAPEPYVVTVAMAAVTVTLTPMSHHNLLIYRPGGYRFSDYARLGLPLSILLAFVAAVVTPLLWRA